MNILEKAIAHEGGVVKLARAYGEKPARFSNWRNPDRGIPDGWRNALVAKYGSLPDIPALERQRRLSKRQAVASIPECGGVHGVKCAASASTAPAPLLGS